MKQLYEFSLELFELGELCDVVLRVLTRCVSLQG